MPNLNPFNWFGRKTKAPQQPLSSTPDPSPAAAGEGSDSVIPDGQSLLAPDAVARALDTLLGTDNWDETRRILEREQALLLTETAQLLLMTNIVATRQQGDDPAAQRWAGQLELHLELLRDAKATTIAEAWPRFMEALRQRSELDGATGNGVADEDHLFRAWVQQPNIMLERRFLEAHPQWASDPATEARIEDVMPRAQAMADEQFAALRPRLDATLQQPGPLPADLEQPLSEWRDLLSFTDDLRARLALLRDIRARAAAQGGDLAAAIRDGYVNAHGGFTLDLPPWLVDTVAQDERLRAGGEADQAAPARVALWRAALTQANQQELAAEIVAEIESNLDRALTDLLSGDTDAAQDEGIGHLESALRVFTLERLPIHYAMTQNNLGVVYEERRRGEKEANQEAAIACYREALGVRTLKRLPLQYATTQNNLGNVYRVRLRGEQEANQEAAIACYQAALRVRTLERLPRDYAMTQNNLGNVYEERLRGDQEANQEDAIACYREALRVRTLKRLPRDYAMTQNNLGGVYQGRLRGEKEANQEAAIACYQAALGVYTPERLPLDYAMTQNGLGNVYQARLRGDQEANQEAAIACYQAALRVYTPERLPLLYATTQNGLGNVYQARLRGDQEANQEAAIACYQAALRVFTLERLPRDYAMTQNNLGIVYQRRLRGDQEANQEAAIACYQAALRVQTLERLPLDHRHTQHNLAVACAEWGMWEQAHAAYQGALDAEELLLAQVSGGLQSSDLVLRQGQGAATRDGYALTRLGRHAEAALAVERGRARGLAQARLRASGDPARISHLDLRSRYQDALTAFNRAQKTSNAPITRDDLRALGGLVALPEDVAARGAATEQAQRTVELARREALVAARASFNAVVTEVRAAGDPADFLLAPLDEATLWRAAAVGGPGHALVYLIATPWGGAAIAAFTANPALKTTRRCLTLELPALTESLVNGLIERDISGGDSRVVAGFAWAQTGRGFGRFLYDWPGETFREKAAALQRGCAAAGVALEQATLATAAQATLATLSRWCRVADTLKVPLATLPLDDLSRLASVFDTAFLRAELNYSLSTLADAALRPLAAWLNEQGATSVTLIPGGGLGTFPLLAAPVAPAGPGETSPRVFADAFPKGASVAPSARALLRIEQDDRDQEGWQVKQSRSGVIALGDPHPTYAPLEWGEAEAITIARLALNAGLPAKSHTRTMARRGWLLHALRTAWVADLSCHGVFDGDSPLDSALRLALDKTLTLRDLLSLGLAEESADGAGSQQRQTDLRGLRLLILSACQTAILDLRGAREEARSLAAGILEAGAEAALASQWSVNDKATYLLMVKFAQLWFPNRDQLAPAAALTLAQRWLRNVTNADLRKWRYDTLAPITADERKAASDEEQGVDPWDGEAEQATHSAAAITQTESVIAHRQASQAAGGAGGEEAFVVSRLRGLRPRRTDTLADDGRADSERGERYGTKEAEEQIHVAAVNERDEDCPFADPFYWAGFQITGW